MHRCGFLFKTNFQQNIATRQQVVRSIKNSRNVYSADKAQEMDQVKDNPYFSKYAEKLKQKEKEKPGEFEASVSGIVAQREKEQEQKRQDGQDVLNRAQEQKAKGLDGVVRLDLLRERSTEDISEIWLEHHKNQKCIYGVVPKDEYEQFHQRIKEFPTFLYPLPRGTGYQFMLQQFENNQVHLTPLALYQEHHENAPTCLVIRYFTELMQEKGVVLMNSDVNTDLISVHEAQLLALQLKMYYGVNSGLKFNHVRMFKNAPDQFKHMDLVIEFERYKQDFKDARDGTWV